MFILILLFALALILGVFLLFGDTKTSQICHEDTCPYGNSREYTIPYSSELNLNSTCDEIKDYILSNLEVINSSTFYSSDDTPITHSMKKELIFVLENSSDMIKNNETYLPGIRFKFCCTTSEDCIRDS